MSEHQKHMLRYLKSLGHTHITLVTRGVCHLVSIGELLGDPA